MKRAIIAVVLISLGVVTQAVLQGPPQAAAQQPSAVPRTGATAQRQIPCKVPENASMCYWTRGRLAFYNGNPPYRVWKVGTKRVLGVFSGTAAWPPKDQSDQLDPELPNNLRTLFKPPGNRIFGDFEICPLESERPGWMQAVCIESATHLFVEDLR
jgi:hypothetical protein